MGAGKKVLIVGPGFIGWNVLELLISEGYTVTGYVRRKEHAKQIEASGASSVLGDLDDTDLITNQTFDHDIVFHTATADHKPSAKAILEGVRQRAMISGQSTIYIHTSGTSVLDDGAHGAFKGEKVYHDNIREEIDSVPEDAPHRPIDLAIVEAQEAIGEAAKIAIMIPPLIYGFNSRHKRLTIQIPTITRFALKHGFAGHIGKGLPVESQIHVMDLARAYIVLLHWMEQAHPTELLSNPYFFCENGYGASWKEVATEVGKGLHAAGKIKDPAPRTIPEDMYQDLFGRYSSAVIGLNSRSRAVRLREMGWQPREKGVWESYREDELPEILKEERKEFHGYGGTAAS
jgi:nucleoside-diphosphate-sugar epimerase